MYWREKNSIFKKNQGSRNKRAIKKLIFDKKVPGLLAYDDKNPVWWCSVSPRVDFIRLENSRVLKPVDDKRVWSVVCFFIDRKYRNKGLNVALLNATKKYVKSKNGKIIEGYPIEPTQNKMPAAFAWTGLSAAFKKANFKEVARRSENRPIMRFYLK